MKKKEYGTIFYQKYAQAWSMNLLFTPIGGTELMKAFYMEGMAIEVLNERIIYLN